MLSDVRTRITSSSVIYPSSYSHTIATDQPGVYQVVTSQTHSLSSVLPQGYIYRINTGGPLPLGTDAVIMVEDTKLITTVKATSGEDVEEKEVETLAQMAVAENVRAPGSDVRKGDLVAQKGEIIRSAGGELGTLAFVGRKEVSLRVISGRTSNHNSF